MISLLIYLVVILLIFSVLWWVLNQLTLPQPVRMVAVVIFALVVVVFLLNLVGGFGGIHGLPLR